MDETIGLLIIGAFATYISVAKDELPCNRYVMPWIAAGVFILAYFSKG